MNTLHRLSLNSSLKYSFLSLSHGFSTTSKLNFFQNDFARRHIGPQKNEIESMCKILNVPSVEHLVKSAIPSSICHSNTKDFLSETLNEVNDEMNYLMSYNSLYRSFIGMGYYNTITPMAIQRAILENPLWYTPYTPYQAEISQGRLELLLHFQTMVSDLTAMPYSNCSLLDEASSAYEAIHLSLNVNPRPFILISRDCHPQIIKVCKEKCRPWDVELKIVKDDEITNMPEFKNKEVSAILLSYPNTNGSIKDYKSLSEQCHDVDTLVICTTDLLALTLFKPPGEWGADIVTGHTQRFGCPLGYGGPHAGFLATIDKYKRNIPGRIIGVSLDKQGDLAYRMCMQTREQHIKRERATSNICTAQALVANISAAYAIYHGPNGLYQISKKIYDLSQSFAKELKKLKYIIKTNKFFDTVHVLTGSQTKSILKSCEKEEINIRQYRGNSVLISFDETTTIKDVDELLYIFTKSSRKYEDSEDLLFENVDDVPLFNARTTPYLTHPVFHDYQCELGLTRYLHKLVIRDVGLLNSMIPLGSCTMKCSSAVIMQYITQPKFNQLHPYVPLEQASGYVMMFERFSKKLIDLLGFDGISLHPLSGAAGEYAGLRTIQAFYRSIHQTERNVCLIPASSHGTNPASASMSNLKIVVVKTTQQGEIDLIDLENKINEYSSKLFGIMITYPSTHGVFEDSLPNVIKMIHDNGGHVYMDGANMNALTGICTPGHLGVDVMHLNLHKTFSMPHGGGGPGLGPILVRRHLKKFLPDFDSSKAPLGPLHSTYIGSPSLIPISYTYLLLMGLDGLKASTMMAIFNANYLKDRLQEHYPILYTGANNRVAHEFIIDLRPFKKSAGVDETDIAKRLIDFGIHAPTVSFPVAGTFMVEPTESENKMELDRFIDSMITIRQEIREIEDGKCSRTDNVLKNAPHTHSMVSCNEWKHPYDREKAAYPLPYLKKSKFWPHVARIDNVFGDRNLYCRSPTKNSADIFKK